MDDRRHGFSKKGRHSVGVTRQYCGQLGKQDNCQVAVSLSLANHDGSLPVAYRLYLPEEWARDRERRDKAKVPDTIAFQTKPEIALEQIKSAYAAGLPQGVVLMDAGYGNDTDLRTQVTALGLSYVAGIGANTAVWPPGTAPLPPLPGSGRGRPPKLLRRDGNDQDLARPVLLLVPPQRSLLRYEHIIARQLTQSAPSRTAIWLNPPALVRLPAESGLRLAPGAKF
jgi:SRSO17 transposase